jgi:hypothetical protein
MELNHHESKQLPQTRVFPSYAGKLASVDLISVLQHQRIMAIYSSLNSISGPCNAPRLAAGVAAGQEILPMSEQVSSRWRKYNLSSTEFSAA